MKALASKLSLTLVAVLFFGLPLVAQNSGSIQGIVVDAAGAVIPGAAVQAKDEAKAPWPWKPRVEAMACFCSSHCSPELTR